MEDIFRKKVVTADIGTFHKEFTGGLDYDKGLMWMKEQYFYDQSRDIYAHVTTAINTDSVRVVWETCSRIILEKHLNLQLS